MGRLERSQILFVCSSVAEAHGLRTLVASASIGRGGPSSCLRGCQGLRCLQLVVVLNGIEVIEPYFLMLLKWASVTVIYSSKLVV